MRRLVALVAVGAMALGLAAGAVAAPQTTLADLEDEVMCPVCGTLLELAEAPQAERQRAYIARMIAAGKTKDQIKDALLAEYGREVLALPRGSGFDLSAYLVPIAGLAIAIVALGLGLLRWRRAGDRNPPAQRGQRDRDAPGARPAGAPEGEDAARLDADISRYDL